MRVFPNGCSLDVSPTFDLRQGFAADRVQLTSVHKSYRFICRRAFERVPQCVGGVGSKTTVWQRSECETLMQFHNLSLLECEGPVPPSTSVACTDPWDSPSFHNMSLRECEGPVPPSTGVACTDPARRSFSRCLSARGLYHPPQASSVPTPQALIQVHNLWLLECDGHVPPSANVASSDSRDAHPVFTTSRCLSAGGLYPLPPVSFVPTPRNVLPATA